MRTDLSSVSNWATRCLADASPALSVALGPHRLRLHLTRSPLLLAALGQLGQLGQLGADGRQILGVGPGGGLHLEAPRLGAVSLFAELGDRTLERNQLLPNRRQLGPV